MASAMALEAWRQEVHARLLPWMTTLRNGSEMFMNDGELIICLDTDRPVDKRVFEAVKLLVLLGHVDFTLWAFEAQEASVHDTDYIDIEGTRASPIVCTLSLARRESAIVDWCVPAILHGVGKGSKSADYDNVRTLIESGRHIRHGHRQAPIGSDGRQFRIPLCVSAFGDDDGILKQFTKIASLQRRRDSVSGSTTPARDSEPRLCVTRISSNFSSRVSLTQLESLAEIATHGVSIDKACLSGLEITPDSPDTYVRCLQVVMSTTTCVDEPAARGSVREITITRKIKPEVIAALFSALRTSRAVKKLDVNNSWDTPQDGPELTPVERQHLWQWLAFSIFSGFAAHRLEQLSVEVEDVSSSDVQAFCDTLARQEEITLDGGRGQKLRVLPRHVIASRFQLAEPLMSKNDAVELPLQRVLVIETTGGIAEENRWVQVLLPGYGAAWVHQDDIRVDGISSQPEWTDRSIPALTLSRLADQSLEPALQLLSSAGHELKKLFIVTINCSKPLDNWIVDVVTACPQLEHFIVRGGFRLTSLDVVVQLYERGLLQANDLGVAEVTVDDMSSITRLLCILEDDSHPMTKCLEKIAICVRALPARIPRLLPALDKLLSVNRRLKDLTFQATYRPGIVPEDNHAVRQLYEKHFDKPVSVRREPMESRAKMALLSVAVPTRQQGRAARSKRVVHVMQNLDRAVLSRVFEFAAVSEQRKLLFRFGTEETGNRD